MNQYQKNIRRSEENQNNFQISETFLFFRRSGHPARYPVTETVDSDVLESSLYIMKACPVMYIGLRQIRLFTTPIRLLIDPYYKTPATTSTPFHTHPSTSRCNFTPHSSLHIPLQLHSSPIPTYSAATPTPSLF